MWNFLIRKCAGTKTGCDLDVIKPATQQTLGHVTSHTDLRANGILNPNDANEGEVGYNGRLVVPIHHRFNVTSQIRGGEIPVIIK